MLVDYTADSHFFMRSIHGVLTRRPAVRSGAALTAPVVGAICVGLGVPTGGLGTLACGVVVVAAGSYVGGAVGGAGGEMFAK